MKRVLSLINKAKNSVNTAAFIADVVSHPVESLKNYLKTTILMYTIPIVVIVLVVFFSLSAVFALADTLGIIWRELDRATFGEYINDETTFEEYCNMPEVLYRSLTFDRFQPDDFGYFYVTEDDMKSILLEVVTYNAEVKRTCHVTAKYYHHWFDYTYNAETEQNDVNHGLSKQETEPAYAVESMETASDYKVYWQEIYALAVMASLNLNTTEWEDIYEEYDSDGDGENDSFRVKPVNRVDSATLQKILNGMKYTFNYWHDASIGDGTPPVYYRTYEYDDMEQYAYIESESGAEKHTGCSEGSLVSVSCAPENVFDYVHKKLPATAPNYAQNVFKTVLWYYDDTTRLMKCKRTVCDPQVFVDFGNEVCGEENFDFEWYVELVDNIPGSKTESGEDLSTELNKIYQAYRSGTILDEYDYLADGVNKVKLGSGVRYSTPSSESDTNRLPGIVDGGNPIVIPDDINDEDIDDYAFRSLLISDELTMEQLQGLLATLFGTDSAAYQGAEGFIRIQNETGVSVCGILAVMVLESGGGRNSLARNYWNFMSQTASQGEPYTGQIQGNSRVWIDYKSKVSAQFPGYSPEQLAAEGIYANCKKFYDSWIVNRSRTYFYIFNTQAPVYCGNAVADAEGMRWIRNVSRMRKQYEMAAKGQA